MRIGEGIYSQTASGLTRKKITNAKKILRLLGVDLELKDYLLEVAKEFENENQFKIVAKNVASKLEFKFFNQNIKLNNQKTELTEIRKEMTLSEISHLIGFIFVTFFAIYKSFFHNFLFGFIIMIVNILMNLYPSLLQQENKRRIDKLIKSQIKP